MNPLASRRGLIVAAASAGVASFALAATGKPEEADDEVTANEDLMREHGIIRRALRIDPAAEPARHG